MKFICFGEILFDIFKDSARIGGAPLNVAAHFQKLGATGTIVSAVGDDELGRSALDTVKKFGIGSEHIHISEFPTGKAEVFLVDGIADYAFNEPCAWDDIKISDELKGPFDVLCYGTLAQRSEQNRKALCRIWDSIDVPVRFFDVNIRKNFYSKEIIDQGLRHATVLKMNNDEIPVIANAADIGKKNFDETIAELFHRYPLDIILVTLGKEGSVCCTKDGKIFRQNCKDITVVDTVGAGDSLSAGFLYMMLKGAPLQQALAFGSTLADYVCAHQGAIPEYDEELLNKIHYVQDKEGTF